MFNEDILLADSAYALEVYKTVLQFISNAQNQLKAEKPNWSEYQGYLEDAHKMLHEIDDLIMNNLHSDLSSNLQMLNNYYKHLCSTALEEKNNGALAELKYHLKEIVAATT